MNKRSKFLLITLLLVVVITFLSLMGEPKNDDEKYLEEFEEDITNPNNTLDPLNQNNDRNVLLIEIALKAENVIVKVFGFVVDLFKTITDKII